MNKKINIHQALTFMCMTVLVAMFWLQARVVLQPKPSLAIETPTIAYGYSSTLASICSNLEAYWRFDDESGTLANDISENAHNGTLLNFSNGSEWTTSVATAITFLNSGAVVLDGSDDYISTVADTGLQITGDITLSAWVKYSSLASGADYNVVVANGSSTESPGDNILYYFNIQSNGTLQIRWESDSGIETRVTSSTASAIQSGVWNHIAVTRDVSENTVKFYDSGSLLGTSRTYTNDPTGGTSSITYIGTNPESLGLSTFNGTLDDIRIYTSVLTGSQISLLSSTGDVYGGCTCGNGVIESPETCDNGSSNSDSVANACRTSCRVAYCGDSITDTGETCDDGNLVDADSCTNSCTSVSCGDGIVNGSEECDNGNSNSNTVVDACRTTCLSAYCGDGIVDTGESCDDAGESATCTSTCTTSSCGDSINNATAGETCDNGGSNSNTAKDACRTTCLVAGCGDAIIDTGEACDDANTINTDSCTNLCYAASCGDSFIQPNRGEECEPPGTKQCASNCKITTGGGRSNARKRNKSDEVVEIEKVYSKRAVSPVGCGDRLIQKEKNEECDEGSLNGKGSCSFECRILYCSDGIISNEIREECEPEVLSVVDGINTFAEIPCGEGTYCKAPVFDPIGGVYRNGCVMVFMRACGDQSDAPEELVSEQSVTENSGIPPSCGNGKIDEGEQCDMGGICNGGIADGIRWIVEDMATSCIEAGGMPVPVSNDGCSDQCLLEVCGNSILEPNGIDGLLGTEDDEECDGSHNCNESCKESVCGNHVLESGEQCDDGDASNNDGCSEFCMFEYCGDGSRVDSEQCDDGNQQSGDGCSNTCLIEVQPIEENKVVDQPRFTKTAEEADPVQKSETNASAKTIMETSTINPIIKNIVVNENIKNLFLNEVSLCGNRVIDRYEECDDGNIIDGDRCSSDCHIEIEKKHSAYTDVLVSSQAVTSKQEDEPIYDIQQIEQVYNQELIAQILNTLPLYKAQQYQQVYYQPQYMQVGQRIPPVGETGPASLLIVTAGASAGIGFVRRKKRRASNSSK